MFLSTATGLAALAVVLVQQVLKLNFVPVSFANKYPVPTLIVLSVVAAVVVTWKSNVQPTNWTQWVALVATIGVVAAVVYNQTLKQWVELRATEGPTE